MPDQNLLLRLSQKIFVLANCCLVQRVVIALIEIGRLKAKAPPPVIKVLSALPCLRISYDGFLGLSNDRNRYRQESDEACRHHPGA